MNARGLAGRVLGHYRIVELLGKGGMGEVYRAHDERLDRDVAIKVLPEEVVENPERLKRFEREAKALAALNHPNIATVHGFETVTSGTETETGTGTGPDPKPQAPSPTTFLVMELLEGESLREVISGGGLTTGKAVEYAKEIADGLAAAHEKSIIHRDLKPENVFLTKDGRIKILDFGLAKLRLPEADLATETPTETLDTAAGGLLGTVPYMAPEQVQGKPADHRSDIFALGVMLYEMVAGDRPFGGATGHETAAAILKEDPEPISKASPGLGSVISKCLEKRPEDRFSSAHDLSLTLGAVDPAAQEKSFVEKRWPHILAAVIAAVIALVFVLPPTGLFERSEEPSEEAAIPRIVVLPFQNLGSPDDEYFADGITEELISRLAAVSGLQVISRTSAMYYKGKNLPLKQIGEELDVGFVLEGTIRWDRGDEGPGRVRITPQLIQVKDDSHLWSERYDRVLEDIFAVQTEIAIQVVGNLQLTLLESEKRVVEGLPTENLEAYQAYLLGVHYSYLSEEEEAKMRAVEMLEIAVQHDPYFAVAHAALSEAHSMVYHLRYDFTPRRLEMAKAAVDRALALDPELPVAQRALGFYYYQGLRDYDRALEHLAVALERVSSDVRALEGTAFVYRRQARWDRALDALLKAKRLSPQGYSVGFNLLVTYIPLRQHELAEAEMRKLITISPDVPDAYYEGALNYLGWDGTTTRAKELLGTAPDMASPYILHTLYEIDRYERDPSSALDRLAGFSEEIFSFDYWYHPKPLLECIAFEELGNAEKADTACEYAVELLELEIEKRPHDYRLYSAAGHAYALLGRTSAAVTAGTQATDLMPISKDALVGSQLAIELAKVYSRVGEIEKAIDLIEDLLSIPCDLSVGLLRLDPVWDPLRDHSRFQEILERYEVGP